jgi:hypothetical protein
MTVVRPSAADEAFLKNGLQSTIIPAFVQRCGTSCGQLFNQYIAPVAGVRWQQ